MVMATKDDRGLNINHIPIPIIRIPAININQRRLVFNRISSLYGFINIRFK